MSYEIPSCDDVVWEIAGWMQKHNFVQEYDLTHESFSNPRKSVIDRVLAKAASAKKMPELQELLEKAAEQGCEQDELLRRSFELLARAFSKKSSFDSERWLELYYVEHMERTGTEVFADLKYIDLAPAQEVAA